MGTAVGRRLPRAFHERPGAVSNSLGTVHSASCAPAGRQRYSSSGRRQYLVSMQATRCAKSGCLVVRQKTMKAYISDPQLITTTPQLRLPVCPQRHRRVIAADRVFPNVIELLQKIESLAFPP